MPDDGQEPVEKKARFARVAALFEGAMAHVDPAAREAFLLTECGDDAELRAEVESLLEVNEEDAGAAGTVGSAFESSWAMDALAKEATGVAPPPVPVAPIPDRIGPYEIERELGAGGMGRVYLGRREGADFDKNVAIKVLRPGMDEAGFLGRFRAERRILAQLDHPYVATLLDGGATDQGLPYLVMEYVEGQDLLEHARGAGLSLDGRLALFERVCEAVAALHRSLIVHRDLKPSNILVNAEGSPKLLDFGIAKILEPDLEGGTVLSTQTGMLLFTPEYGSPEQSRGEVITTATDVYSLGVILYELLSGQRPYAFETRTPAGIERVLSEVEPPPMSTVAREHTRALAGDLDTIVAMALRKEPERRYASVALLLEDIQRHRAGLPVRARADTLRYRATKFVRRHAGWVTAAAVFAALLVGFAISMGLQAERTARQRDLADERAEAAWEVSRFLVDLFRVSAPDEAVGEQISARSLLDRGARQIRYDVEKDPSVRAALLEAMGRAYLALGNTGEAADLLGQAEGLLGADATKVGERASVQAQLGSIRFLEGKSEEAEAIVRRSLVDLTASYGRSHREVAAANRVLSTILGELGRFDEALTAASEARAIAESITPVPVRDQVKAILQEALHRESLGQFDDAEALLLEVQELQRGLFDGDHPDVSVTQRTFALLYESQGRLDEGIAAIEEAIRIDTAVMGADHPNVDDDRFTLAALYKESGDLQGALTLYQEILERDRARYGEHAYVALDLGNIAGIYSNLGDLKKAEEHYNACLELQRRVLPPGHPEIGTTLSNIGATHRRAHKFELAVPLFEEALAIREKVFPPGHHAILTSQNMLAVSYQDMGKPEKALELAKKVLDAREAQMGSHRQVAGSYYTVGSILDVLGRYDESDEHLKRAVEIFRAELPADHLDLARPLASLGESLAKRGQDAAARPFLTEALTIRKGKLPPDHRAVRHVQGILDGLAP